MTCSRPAWRRRPLRVAAVTAFAATLHIVTSPLNGQVTASVTTGVNLSSFEGDGVGRMDVRYAPFASASLARHPWGSTIGVEAVAGYVPKGSSWIDDVDVLRSTLRLSYLEAQALLRAALHSEGSELRPVVFIGPSAAWLLSCSMHGRYGGSTVTRECTDPGWQGTLDIEKMDLGLTLGITLEFRAGRSLTIAPRFSHTRGLQRLGMGPPNEELDVKNSNTLIGLGAIFLLR